MKVLVYASPTIASEVASCYHTNRERQEDTEAVTVCWYHDSFGWSITSYPFSVSTSVSYDADTSARQLRIGSAISFTGRADTPFCKCFSDQKALPSPRRQHSTGFVN
jgi:hypothetical protein